MDRNDAHASSSTYARLAGLTYLVVIVLPLVGLALVQPHLATDGDAVEVARRLAAQQPLFRAGLALDLAMFTGVLVLAAAHHVLLARVDRSLSLIALVLRSAEGILGIVTLLAGAAVAAILSDGASVEASAPLVAALLRARAAGMDFVLVLLCLGAIPFCWLFFVSRAVPRLLSGFGIACYALILAGSITNILTPAYAEWTILAFAPGTLFELSIGLWLLVRGVRFEAQRPIATDHSMTAAPASRRALHEA